MNEVLKNIFQFQVPLRNNPLKELNVYVIKGEKRNLIIDTGFNNEQALNAFMSGLNEINVSLDDSDIFLTHLHVDHTGLISSAKTLNNKAYISARDGAETNEMLLDEYWQQYGAYHSTMGFPKNDKASYEEESSYLNKHSSFVDFTYVQPGDMLSVGEYTFEIIDLKGHTPGHLGLYENEKHILFSGDTLLNKITPNITMWDLKHDYLGQYINTLKRLKNYNIKKVFSSHRSEIEDPYARIEQLLNHHEIRLTNILSFLEEGDLSIYDIASRIKWDFGGGNFIEFPMSQKHFASQEAYAHLIHLEGLEKVTKYLNSEGIYLFNKIN